jgi:NADH-quinone oxidoreductase subunit A
VLLTVLGCSYLLSALFSGGKPGKASSRKPYACGEDFNGTMIQPDYSQFFPFAFFFTIIHVVALTVWTIPAVTTETLVMASVYLLATVVGLTILMRK